MIYSALRSLPDVRSVVIVSRMIVGLLFGTVATFGQVDVAGATNLIGNGGFESPIGERGFGVGSGLTPWEIIAGSVELIRETWPPYEGAQSVDLAGSTNSVIEQTFGTLAGRTYVLQFWYANNYGGGLGSADVTVLSGASTLFADAVAHTGSTLSNMNWTHYSNEFTADSSSATLRFSDTSPVGFYGLALDGVSVVALVPEPSSCWLGCWLLLLPRRRRIY